MFKDHRPVGCQGWTCEFSRQLVLSHQYNCSCFLCVAGVPAVDGWLLAANDASFPTARVNWFHKSSCSLLILWEIGYTKFSNLLRLCWLCWDSSRIIIQTKDGVCVLTLHVTARCQGSNDSFTEYLHCLSLVLWVFLFLSCLSYTNNWFIHIGAACIHIIKWICCY